MSFSRISFNGPFIVRLKLDADVDDLNVMSGIEPYYSPDEKCLLLRVGFTAAFPGRLRWDVGGIQFHAGNKPFAFRMSDIEEIFSGIDGHRIWSHEPMFNWNRYERLMLRVNGVSVWLQYDYIVDSDGVMLSLYIADQDHKTHSIHESIKSVMKANHSAVQDESRPDLDFGNRSEIRLLCATMLEAIDWMRQAGMVVTEEMPNC